MVGADARIVSSTPGIDISCSRWIDLQSEKIKRKKKGLVVEGGLSFSLLSYI